VNKWPYTVTGLTKEEILQAVKDGEWQEFRLSLKGLSTQEKLERLEERMLKEERRNGGGLSREQEVRIDNYINALLRGGQLIRQGRNIVVNR
jgi:hypothetical protein